MAVDERRPRVTDFYEEVVQPALMSRLDQAFPEFGWRRDARGWVATNQEHTHVRLRARADRVVAHEPQGFLVHGGEAMFWTAYVNGGTVPRGVDFVRVVKELAVRAGVDPTPIERPTPPDRRGELLETFFELAGRELVGERGAEARVYLERRGFPLDAIELAGLGVVPPIQATRRALAENGYTEREIQAAGILADTRWPGRLCGAWRNEWGRIGTLWARAVVDDGAEATRYLYLRGASRTNLSPYGLPRHTREVVLVEGFLDYHQLAARGIDNVAALGGTSTNPRLFERLSQLGVEIVVLCLDNDDAGRAATAKAVEHAARARTSPAIYAVNTEGIGAKDPDALLRGEGIDAWRELMNRHECGIVWRVKQMVKEIDPHSHLGERREALRRAGAWLGTLPPRLALEQEDAVKVAAERCGYSAEAVQRAFRARFFRDLMPTREQSVSPEPLERRRENEVEL
jgi:DNA primase